MAIVVGIDPGTRVLGYGVVKIENGDVRHWAHGIFRAQHGAGMAERLAFLAQELAKCLALYQPEVVVVERVFLGKNVESAFALGHIRGVCLSEAAQLGAQVAEHAVRQVKKGITGNGNASKEHVQFILRHEFALREPLPLDASDALALANYHARQLLLAERWRAQEKGSSL